MYIYYKSYPTQTLSEDFFKIGDFALVLLLIYE